ncbi:MAG: hypothetical protein VYE73_01920 [Acidobacteriota bacterium]|nr:hypothetical protein [Acidobacteriota bacterium]
MLSAKKTEFISTVSRELKNPLHSLGMALDVLSSGKAGAFDEGAAQQLPLKVRVDAPVHGQDSRQQASRLPIGAIDRRCRRGSSVAGGSTFHDDGNTSSRL